jgi:hypothetical protein
LAKSIAAVALLFVCLMFSTSPVSAQGFGTSLGNRVPFVRSGYFYGRTGTALGSGGYLEINPSRWLGFCGFAAHSSATSERDGGRAHGWDFSTGVCITAHAPEAKGFLISPFVQIAYQSDHGRLVIPLDDGTTYQEGEDHGRHLLTVGASVDRAIVKNGPRWVVRVGRNLGDGPAAKNAKGLYLVGGVILPLSHPVELGQSLRKMVGGNRHAADPYTAGDQQPGEQPQVLKQ